VKLATFRCAEALALLYSVLMNCVTRGFYSFRKSSEVKLQTGSVVQLLPRGVGHSGLPAGVTRKRGVPHYSTVQAKCVFTELWAYYQARDCSERVRPGSFYGESAHVGVGSTAYWLGLFRVRLEFSASFASQRS